MLRFGYACLCVFVIVYLCCVCCVCCMQMCLSGSAMGEREKVEDGKKYLREPKDSVHMRWKGFTKGEMDGWDGTHRKKEKVQLCKRLTIIWRVKIDS